ncbi:MAG: hypothetical protein AB9866_07810 [Syntrophobacteraceae bacterium]
MRDGMIATKNLSYGITLAEGEKCALSHPIQNGTLLQGVVVAIYLVRLCTHFSGMFF